MGRGARAADRLAHHSGGPGRPAVDRGEGVAGVPGRAGRRAVLVMLGDAVTAGLPSPVCQSCKRSSTVVTIAGLGGVWWPAVPLDQR